MSTPAMHLQPASAAPGEMTCAECGSLFRPRRSWQERCSKKCRKAFHSRERRKKLIEARALVMFQALQHIAQETGTPYATEAAKAIEGLKAP